MGKIICGDCLEEMRRLPEHSVDLVFGSPPYEDARTYGIDFSLKARSGSIGWSSTRSGCGSTVMGLYQRD